MVKRIVVICGLFMFMIGVVNASNFYKEKLTIKIGYQHYPWMGDDGNLARTGLNFTPTGYVESNYSLYDIWEIGANLGGSLYERNDYSNNTGKGRYFIEVTLKPFIIYGIDSKINLLPLLYRKCSFIDLYISSELGGIYFVNKNKSKYAKKRSQWDYGVYGGVTVYPFKRWGFYCEYGFGNYVKWKTGVSLRF
jgi:hypothetical protein